MKPTRDWQDVVLYSIIFLFFFQLITDFVEAIYAFGLMGTDIPNEIVAVVLLFSPVLLIFFRRGLPNWALISLGEVALAARVIEPLLDTRGRMIVSGIGVAAFLIWLPALIHKLSCEKRPSVAYSMGSGLIFAIALSVVLRTLGSGRDISTDGAFQFIGWVLAAAAAILLFIQLGSISAEAGREIPNTDRQKGGFWRLVGLSLGIVAVLVMLYFAFTSPNIIARWTGARYAGIVALQIFALALFGYIYWLKPGWKTKLSRMALAAWNGLFLVALLLTILAYQINFPGSAGGYPFLEPARSSLYQAPVILMMLLFPVIFFNFWRYLQGLLDMAPSLPALGGAFSLASFFMLVLILSHAFTTTYDYIPLIGPFFRDKFWLVYLTVGAAAFLPLFLLGKKHVAGGAKATANYWAVLAILGLSALAAVWWTSARPMLQLTADGSFTVLTYNIQQGYSQDGLKNYEGQLDLIRSLDPDIIGLQESDTNRIAGGNADLVRYFADKLDMYSYYGPKTVPGTFGIALLSKYPIEAPKTFYLYSTGEQTAAIQAGIEIGGQYYNVFVTHLGNGGPIFQQEALLKEINGKESVIAMGDFNFKPESRQYRISVDVLADAWLLKWPSGVDDRGADPTDRIDHIFLSPGIDVIDARYLFSPQSDHPAFVITIAQ